MNHMNKEAGEPTERANRKGMITHGNSTRNY